MEDVVPDEWVLDLTEIAANSKEIKFTLFLDLPMMKKGFCTNPSRGRVCIFGGDGQRFKRIEISDWTLVSTTPWSSKFPQFGRR